MGNYPTLQDRVDKYMYVGADAVLRQQRKHAKSSKKRDAVGQWVQVRRPSAYGRTQAEMHRCVHSTYATHTHICQGLR